MLTRAGLLGGSACIALAGAWGARRWGRAGDGFARAGAWKRVRAALERPVGLPAPAPVGAAAALGVVALAAWAAFTMWRGATVFSPNHDGVAYHLPKAALLARAHGYHTFDGPDARVSYWPCNYELLLADALVLDGSDVHTPWVTTAQLVLWLLAVGALAERWWGRGMHVLLAILLAAGVTEVLLLADVHKNDLLLVALFLLATGAAARWATEGEAEDAGLAVLATAIALGTKGSALFLVAALAPIAVGGGVRVLRRGGARSVRPRVLAAWALGVAAAGMLLGGAVFARNLLDAGRLMPSDRTVQPIVYGDFANLWRFPYLAFVRPFSLGDYVWIPWRQAYWHCARHDFFFGEWGIPSSLLLAASPLGVLRYARSRVELGAAPMERALASAALLLAFFLFLPLRVPTIGVLGFLGITRYTFFVPVLAALWSVVPAAAEAMRDGGPRGVLATAGALLTATILFAGYAAYEAVHDVYEPLDYVLSIRDRPEERRVRRSGQNFRAGVVVDRVAGPNDAIAFDGGFDGWSYYAFGAGLTRPVTYLHPDRGLPVAIPPEVKWVVVDRIVNVSFGHPRFRDDGDWSYLGRGAPTREDRAVIEQLSRDPRFRLVYADEEENQAIFARVPGEPAG